MLEKNRILMQIVWSLFPVGPIGKKIITGSGNGLAPV